MEVCPERDPVERHIVLAVGRRDEMRGLESLDSGLARQNATISIVLKNHRAEPGLALGSAIRRTRAFATGSEVERFPSPLRIVNVTVRTPLAASASAGPA